MKSLVLMPPLRYTSESAAALGVLYSLYEYGSEIHYVMTEKVYDNYFTTFPEKIVKPFLKSKEEKIKLIRGPLYSPFLDLIRIKNYTKKNHIDRVFNMYYVEYPIGMDVSYVVYPHSIIGYFKDFKLTYSRVKYPYLYTSRLLTKRIARSKNLLCSSNYIKNLMKNIGFDCDVVYPPVIPPENYETREKQNIVVGIGKFIPSKHWEEFIEIAKKVRQKNPTIKFKIIGGLNMIMYPSNEYYEKLVKLAGNDVELLTDVNEEEKWRALSSAKIILHCMREDNFGLGVAEAMYAGAVPIVYKSSGTWEDTIQEGKYGIGYKTIEEAKEEIIKIIEDEKTYKEYSEKAKQRATQFVIDEFKSKIIGIMDRFN